MKKTLLLQTALVAAAGLFVADIANAQTKEVPIGVTVGGYFNQMFQVQDRGVSGTAADTFRDHGFKTDSEIWFNVRGVLTDGTVIGARVELESSTYQDQIDERYMFIERADIGRVELGSTDSVTTKMIYAAPNALPNYSTTVHSEYSAVVNAPLMRFVNNLDDNERINLYTASNRYFGSKAGKGLQLGVTYMPDACQDFSVLTNACTGQFLAAPITAEQQFQVAANYLESFGSVDAALYAGYTSAKIIGTGATGVGSDRESGWQVGAQLTYNVGDGSSVQFGGGYNNEDIGGVSVGNQSTTSTTATIATKDREAFSLGARYLTNGAAPGSVGIGVEYWNRDDKLAAGTKIDQDYYHLGLTYQIAAGILGFAGVGVSDTNGPGTTNDVDQTFGVVGINLTF